MALPHGLSGFFLVPDTPEVRALVASLNLRLVPGSRQTVNSWGCRGPEPDPSAALRGLVLGDSFMQGLFVGDDETPPATLARALENRLGGSVSIVNTGHLGYSPEQYYFSLREYVDRIRPHFVVMSICENDFQRDDWNESLYWLGEILQFCRSRGLLCLTVPVPNEIQVVGRRRSGVFQGRLSNEMICTSLEYFNPTDSFVNAHLDLTNANLRRGLPFARSPLFNVHLDDGHFSAAGARIWGDSVARRVVALLERARLNARPSPTTKTAAATAAP
jgi:lysophospholipase L1-like esterase